MKNLFHHWLEPAFEDANAKLILESTHSTSTEFGGLARVTPVYATFFMIVALSSLGLPGLNGLSSHCISKDILWESDKA